MVFRKDIMFSIVIPNYNKPDLLDKCIKSILAQKVDDCEIIIVDNGSSEKCSIGSSTGNIRLISLSENNGFSKAVNIGIREATGDYIAILNNDTELASGWIKNVIRGFEQNPEIMFVTVKIKNFNNRELVDDVGDVILSSGKVYKIGNSEKDTGQYDQPREVFGASGCASVYRREFFDRVGYFDEDFFAYLEDIDLSFRACLYGLKCLYLPDAVVYHVGSATTGGKYNKFTVFHHARNTINVIVKDFPAGLILKSIFRIIWYIAAMQAFFILKGLGCTYFKGVLKGLAMIGKMIPKRDEIMLNRVIGNRELNDILKRNNKLYRISRENRIKL